jgi:hypothetical protein
VTPALAPGQQAPARDDFRTLDSKTLKPEPVRL